MARRNSAPSVRFINHKKYILEKRNLLCRVNVSDPKILFDLHSKTISLYYPKGKEFVLETVSDMTDRIIDTKVISEHEAKAFMDKYSYGIQKDVYIRHFGEPADL